MKTILRAALGFVITAVVGTAALADAPPPEKPLVINPSGTFGDSGVWLYRTAAGLYGFGPATVGTNEKLVMPAPSPEPGGAVVGIEILRHSFNTLGYPMHIALVEKLFAASYQISVTASEGGTSWRYDYGAPATEEKLENGKGQRPPVMVWGPFHGDAIPTPAPDPAMSAAFNFASDALHSISNLPESQKRLANYGVLFIDDGSTVWVEFGPRFAQGEAPHLGCQTQLGRDMVFGYDKKQTGQTTAGKFLQCF